MVSPVDPRRGLGDPRAANADSVTPVPPPATSIPTTRAVLNAGWTTGLTAAILCLGLRVVAGLFGTEFVVAAPGGVSVSVSWWWAFVAPLVVGMTAALLGALFLGVRGCRRWVFWTGTLVLAATLVAPFAWSLAATWPTHIWLAVMQILTWVLVVPQVARVVGDSDPRVTAAYRDAGE